MRSEPKRRLYAGCAMLVLLSACNDIGTKKPVTQVAAKVDGEEISIHQINVILSRTQDVTSGDAAQLRKEVLDKLIDQQVIYAKAIEKKLDRDPQVMMLIEAARREILARAYMDMLLSSPEKISPSDIHQYYVENPALFSNRKLYKLQEIVLPATPELLDPLTEMAADGRSIEAISKYLADKNIRFSSTDGTRAAEQIPLDVLPRLAVVPDGKTELIESGKRFYIFHVLSSQIAAIEEADARQHIEIFLSNQQAQRIATQELKRLKAGTHIEYLGDFAKTVTTDSGNTIAALKPERSAQ